MEASDGELARQVAAGTVAAEVAVVRRFAPRIRSYGLRHLRDAAAADDLVQQVLIVVIEALRGGTVREPDRLGSFVLGTCRLTVRSLVGGERRRDRLLDRYDLGEPAVDAVTPLPLDRLRHCLEHLPPREQAIVALTFYVDRDGDQIAAELGMTAGNVRVARHRALAHLHECMTAGTT